MDHACGLARVATVRYYVSCMGRKEQEFVKTHCGIYSIYIIENLISRILWWQIDRICSICEKNTKGEKSHDGEQVV